MNYGSANTYSAAATGYSAPAARPYTDASAYADPQRSQPASTTALDFSAPVIHFGTSRDLETRPTARDPFFTRAVDEKFRTTLFQLTKEQKLLSFFIGGIPQEFDDYWMERMLKVCSSCE